MKLNLAKVKNVRFNRLEIIWKLHNQIHCIYFKDYLYAFEK